MDKTNGQKIYGVYAGSIKNITHLEICGEDDLYFILHNFKKRLASYRRFADKLGKNMEDAKLMSELEYAIQYCIYKTTRFGVEVPAPEPGKRIGETDSFLAWYAWWDDFFQSDMLVDKRMLEYSIAKLDHEDVSKFRPQGDWHLKVKSYR